MWQLAAQYSNLTIRALGRSRQLSLQPAMAVSVSSGDASACLITPRDAIVEVGQWLACHIALSTIGVAGNREASAACLRDLFAILAWAQGWSIEQ